MRVFSGWCPMLPHVPMPEHVLGHRHAHLMILHVKSAVDHVVVVEDLATHAQRYLAHLTQPVSTIAVSADSRVRCCSDKRLGSIGSMCRLKTAAVMIRTPANWV